MISNFSDELTTTYIDYPNLGKNLPFSQYIANCETMISQKRPDLFLGAHVLSANSPFELKPSQPIMENNKIKHGILLVHGLFDCPFSLRDIGIRLQQNGMLARSILLPGHGTKPHDLLKVQYQNWIKTVQYGVDSLKQVCDEITIIGFSTGAALAVYEAIKNPTDIKKIVLLAPAIKIKAPVDIVVAWHYFLKHFSNNKDWIYKQPEINYVKYSSIPFNAVRQVSKLTTVIDELNRENPLKCPVFMAVSREDETISSHTAMDFFTSLENPDSQLLLYTSYKHAYPDKRIITKEAFYPTLKIKHFSHMAIPFAPNNPHYGQHGDYVGASRVDKKGYIFGAYNHIEISMLNSLKELRLLKQKRHELTYNPDFDHMAEKIVEFIKG